MLSLELEKWQAEIEKQARNYGLDFFETIFEVVDFKQMNEVAAYGGFPNRYPHWKFGMEFEQISKSHTYGLSKIYEIVVNNNPCYAYLMHSNNLVDQKLVMAHVYAHCDFFKNNVYFAHTNRHMIDEMANHKTHVARTINKQGYETVEAFVDVCLSLDNLIDYHAPFIRRRDGKKTSPLEEEDLPQIPVPKLKSTRDYLERYINPKEFIEAQQKKLDDKKKSPKKFPESPYRDCIQFLIESALLENWQRDILSIVREEAAYFAPQGQTKIMNEGWASYWHSKIMTEKILTDADIIDFADHHSGTVAVIPGKMNPYKIGLELFRDIEDRWNKGKFGKEYDECDDLAEKLRWNRNVGGGREKIFEVRKLYNDVTFIDTFLTPEFCSDHKLFAFEYNPQTHAYEISSRDFATIKKKMLFGLTNFGQPIIEVVDANYGNRSELLLFHRHEGVDLRVDYAREVLKNLFVIWKRPVLIETKVGSKLKIYAFDGREHHEYDTKEGV